MYVYRLYNNWKKFTGNIFLKYELLVLWEEFKSVSFGYLCMLCGCRTERDEEREREGGEWERQREKEEILFVGGGGGAGEVVILVQWVWTCLSMNKHECVRVQAWAGGQLWVWMCYSRHCSVKIKSVAKYGKCCFFEIQNMY